MLAEHIPQIVFVCRLDGWNIYFNRRWVEYTGMSLEDSSGHGWTKAFHPQDQSHGSHAAEGHGAYEVENRLRRADGTYRWFLIRGYPLTGPDGTVDRWFGTCTDIEELKNAEAALRRAQEELEERVAQRTRDLTLAIAEAKRANEAKSQFLSRMSHELRTPLNAIIGFGQILTMDPSQIDPEPLEHILRAGRHLLGLINEVLDITSVEAGRLDLSIEPVSLECAIEEACGLLKPLAAERKVRLILPSAYASEHALADNQRLKQVLINLISNGIKYNREGGELEVTCVSDSESVTIHIRDTGPGLNESELARLFTPFERLAATNTSIEGSGLGLALAKQLVAAMQGKLGVTSKPGHGSTFSVTLARARSQVEELSDVIPCVSTEEVRPTKQYTVVCVEDNLSNLRVLEILLSKRKHIKLVPAMQGSVGLDLAKQHVPSLILLDLNLPDISGKEVLTRLRQSELTKHIPVVITSADATPSQIERLMAAGAYAYLTKPLDIPEFLKLLDHILESGVRAA